MTYTFTLQIDLHEGAKWISPERLAIAIHRILTHATEVDIAGAEIFDARIGQISVVTERARGQRSTVESEPSRCRQTACKHCGQDIENLYPYRRGEWRDRGNNSHCPTPEGDAGQIHQPVKDTP
jgi:hypothetical protein